MIKLKPEWVFCDILVDSDVIFFMVKVIYLIRIDSI